MNDWSHWMNEWMKSQLPRVSSFNSTSASLRYRPFSAWAHDKHTFHPEALGTFDWWGQCSDHYQISTIFYNIIILYSYQLWQYSISAIISSFSHVVSGTAGQNNEKNWPVKALSCHSNSRASPIRSHCLWALFQGSLWHTHLKVLCPSHLLFSSHPELSSFCAPFLTSLFLCFPRT